ncbi:MAG TPA: protein kinase [Polyangia bacterium]|nr:protein kinase [Polyangia bacterium]
MNASQQTAARRYRIERYLTEGGMGAIYIGKKLGPGGFEKEVVLKQLLPEYTARPEFRDLFFREAKISATLDHANIVHTFDLVESDESLFIVMEYVRGVDLRTIVRRARLRRRELAPGAAIHIVLDVLAGLGYAHTRKDASGASLSIIHRDVSPSNILCSAEGEVKLSDFGIAKASTHSSVFYRVRGKVGYMSPEQARNEPVDHRSDLYSLGVCLHEALTGERLFVGDLSTPPDVIYGQPILPPSKKRPGLPAEIDEVLAKALAPKPDDRYQDATAFTEALRQAAHRFGLTYSTPQLADHLRNILGPDPTRWLNEEPTGGAEHGTQKIPVPTKAHEGKEAASIGLVEGSNLYVVSGGDVVSPSKGAMSSSRPPSPGQAPRSPGREEGPTRKVSVPTEDAPMAKAPTGPFIPIKDDDEDAPTVARNLGPAAAASVGPPLELPRRPSTAPYSTLSSSGRKKPATIPPPPPAAAFAPPPSPPSFTAPSPPVPVFAPGGSSFTAPPPPMPPSRSFGSDSPFDPDMPTPPPPPTDEVAPPTPLPTYPSAPGPAYGNGPPPGAPGLRASSPGLPRPSAGWAPAPAPAPPSGNWGAPLNLQAPETIDFAADAAPLTIRRSGPPGLVWLIFILGAMAGGAKLAEVVTRADVAGLEAPATTPGPTAAPASR